MKQLPIEIDEFREFEAQYRIDGVWYGIQVYYNSRALTWFMDITTEQGEMIKPSVPLVAESIIFVEEFTSPLYTVPENIASPVPGVGFNLYYGGE